MTVGFRIDFIWYEIGTSDFLHAFFSTISFHLEPKGWGSVYPYLMKQLYDGRLNWKDVNSAIHEVHDIRKKLEKYGSKEVIWDIEDLKKEPPWGNHISQDITSLSNYFVTSDGRDLFDVLIMALNDSLELKVDVEIVSI